ncbi:unnamed protein product [Spirodela intermedia]|uniref:Potassium transporter n=1 Tax=Spirodela intermedia TaxID=51605 RepID=A0A7I8JKS8_SPIIN|nr:unnamed protein product [Spirodela intermedia]CAA6670072.1 unnamed protein product [Spirodela intermedia]
MGGLSEGQEEEGIRLTVAETRWVDGSEVDSASPPSYLVGDGEEDSDLWERSEGERMPLRRRLIRKVKRADSFDKEAMGIGDDHKYRQKDLSVWETLAMAFQTLGVVYGDLGTSPLYVFGDVFRKVPITSEVDVLGALSLVMYTIALIPFAKYVLIVLKANNNGEGGTFALYSLICRYANVHLLPNRQRADENISSFRLRLPTPELERSLNIKSILERRSSLKTALLLLVLTGTSMIIGDGIFTPSISVMSAVSGLQGAVPGFSTNALVLVSIIILVGLFSIQRFGTSKVGFMFAPLLALWFLSLGSIGAYNLVKYDIHVLKAFNPAYIYLFFKKNSRKAWSALGGCVLCITGAEAMFADLGHFSVTSIQIGFTCVVFPCLLLAYMGQAAYLTKNPNSGERIFYDSVPEVLFWPMFVVATLAAMVASQAMISATFSCVKQAMALGCFPRLNVVHTSRRLVGQVYIPVINWFLMIMCIVVVAAFGGTIDIANAYGVAEVGVMLITTILVTLVMLLIWQTSRLPLICFPAIFGTVELIYLTAALTKVAEGGWLPLAVAAIFLCIMYSWSYGSALRYGTEVREKISMEAMLGLGPSLGTVRVPGIGLLYSELVQGVPPALGRFLCGLPAIHSTVIFVCIKCVPVPAVPPEERFLFRRVCPPAYHLFRCEEEAHRGFERLLVESLETFLRREAEEAALELSISGDPSGQRAAAPPEMVAGLEEELAALREATESGFTYLLAHGEVRARKQAWFLKKLAVNYVYAFLRRNCMAGAPNLSAPRVNTIRVRMTYMV